jgi:predicted SnoaL-like aldol condensation-catalyzing enzyme
VHCVCTRRQVWDLPKELLPKYRFNPLAPNRLHKSVRSATFPKIFRKDMIVNTNRTQNIQNVKDFYTMTFVEGNPAEAVKQFVGDEYIQHNPIVADGKEAFIAYFNEMAEKWPDKQIYFERSIAENDLVVLHCRQVWPGDSDYATIDIFRLGEDGKIVEHWDVMQEVPATSKHNNTMF